MPALDRRSFLGLTGAAAAASLLGGFTMDQASAAVRQAADPAKRTLLVIDLQGGNDALNTLIPPTGIYHDLRPTLGLADNDLLTFNGLDYGVNPALASLQGLWDAGHMTALYGTGLQGQSRSHFAAQDAWRTARPGVPARSGWLGRWLEATPTDAEIPLRAIALGQSALAAQGEEGRPVAIQSVDGFQLNPPRGNSAVTDAVLAMGSPLDDGLFGQAQAAIPQTVEAVTQLQDLIATVETNEDEIDANDDQALFSAAQAIIQGEVGTQVLYVTIGGFDTHSLQAPKQDLLWRLVADGLGNLFSELEESGHAENTLALVLSEFGRRAAENGSAGTDHGQGGLSFLCGPAVAQSTVVGEPDLNDLVDGDLRITIDARDIYSDALHWLGTSDRVVADVLGGDWNNLDLLT